MGWIGDRLRTWGMPHHALTDFERRIFEAIVQAELPPSFVALSLQGQLGAMLEAKVSSYRAGTPRWLRRTLRRGVLTMRQGIVIGDEHGLPTPRIDVRIELSRESGASVRATFHMSTCVQSIRLEPYDPEDLSPLSVTGHPFEDERAYWNARRARAEGFVEVADRALAFLDRRSGSDVVLAYPGRDELPAVSEETGRTVRRKGVLWARVAVEPDSSLGRLVGFANGIRVNNVVIRSLVDAPELVCFHDRGEPYVWVGEDVRGTLALRLHDGVVGDEVVRLVRQGVQRPKKSLLELCTSSLR